MPGLPVTPKALAPELWQEPGGEVLSLIEGLATEMAQRWRQGECPLAEEFFTRQPELCNQREAALELIAEELALRQETGCGVDLIDLQQRFPQWRQEVETLARCHHLLAPVRLPAVGDMLGEFRLLAVLGRGALGRVYLATQPSLAGRPVVLKLSPDRSGEHLSLARLQHTHIVPLLSVHEFPAHNLYGLCLPYLGGTTLAALLDRLCDRPPAQRTGADLLAALQQAQAAAQARLPIGGPACQFLEKASYVQAVCWMGMCLAEALQYAHERDLIHLDVKPSNILLAADGQPMLLDFHLAGVPLSAGASCPSTLGGTPTYMAPEHQAALEAVRDRRAIPSDVEGRADVYALALVMLEALGGRLPDRSETASTLRERNPLVTAGLTDLLSKCLAPQPRQRYLTAGDLAADLRRYLSDLPLRGVPNGSLTERWRRWRRRRPYALPLLGLSVAIVTGAVMLFDHAERLSERAEAACQQGDQYLIAGRPEEALENFGLGVALIEDLPMNGQLLQRLKDGSQRARCIQAAAALHQSCEQMRALDGSLSSTAQRRAVERMCTRLWQDRGRIVQSLGQLPTTELEEQVRADLLDVAIVWSVLHMGLDAEGDMQRAREEALEVLNQAEALFGPSCVLGAERRALGRPKSGEESIPAPRNAWEHYALGRLYLRTGEMDRAAAAIDRALALQPQSLWANFYKGRYAFQSGAYEDAVVAFSVCTALTPTSAWAVYHRGLTYLKQERLDRARKDFDAALRLDPSLTAAVLGRGIVNLRQKRDTEALTDLRRVLELEPTNEQARKLLEQLEQRP